MIPGWQRVLEDPPLWYYQGWWITHELHTVWDGKPGEAVYVTRIGRDLWCGTRMWVTVSAKKGLERAHAWVERQGQLRLDFSEEQPDVN